MARRRGGFARWGVGHGLLRAKQIVGADVVSRRGDSLGTVEDVVVDTVRGSISYAVLSFGGFLGRGNKLFAIPWQALYVDSERHNLVLDVPREVLEHAPGFEPESWPDMSDPGWQSRIHGYYGYQPIQPRTGGDIEAERTGTDIEQRITAALAASARVEDVTEEPIEPQLAKGITTTDLEAREDAGPEETEAEGRRRRAA